MVTIFCVALFNQFSFKLLSLSKEDQDKVAHFFKLILKNLGFRHLLYYNLQILILVLGVIN
jgi:hypothetical protein